VPCIAQVEPSSPSAGGLAIAQVQPLTTTRALQGPFDYVLPEELRDGAVGVGSMLVVPFGRREVLGVVVGLAEHSDVAEERLLAPVRALELGVPADLVELAEWLATEYCSTTARALGLVLPPGAARRLSGRKRRAVARPRHRPVGSRSPHPPELTDEQQRVLFTLAAVLERRTADERLLYGVTGSGKTEIYLRAAAIALEHGRGAIVLVPEIALTPQIVGRFVERFGETVAVLHSRLRPAERYAEWRRLREGEARVCVGPRSAVFAPIDDLGLIVIDEEHDSSYKHEGDPRYDARDVAAERAARCGALLLMGSATPRPESVHRVGALTLPRRVDGRPLPQVDVLDMRGESHGLHPLTAQALAEVRAERGKAIVLLNRRGWSNFLSCRSCGRVWSCPECDVALVLHRAGGFIACHHCGHRERVPDRCSGCSSTSVARHGAGTERLEHDLSALLDDGDFPVFRLDADVLAGGGLPASAQGAAAGGGAGADAAERDVGALLRSFEAADCGALIGTQMVAKGHDFPDVTLGVVLDADATLRFPDFRAEERTFALIAQLAGRVGRGAHGRVLVQTIAPEARSILQAAQHDSAGFLAGELDRRRALGYPPFSHLIRVVCAAPDARAAQAAAQDVGARLREAFGGRSGLADAGLASGSGPDENPVVLGPAALFRLRGRERRVLVVKSAERRSAVAAVGEAVQQLSSDRDHAGVSFSVDVDPQ
jgi:primosomal protein N' (replication factor Y)